MLPECRTEGDPFEVPVFTIDKGDIEDFLDELKGFHGEFRECFLRSEPRENFYRYMVGQFSELERKSIEPIALAVEDGAVRSMQRAISDAPWDEKKMKSKYRYLLAEDMGDTRGVLIFDETGYLKKGSD